MNNSDESFQKNILQIDELIEHPIKFNMIETRNIYDEKGIILTKVLSKIKYVYISIIYKNVRYEISPF